MGWGELRKPFPFVFRFKSSTSYFAAGHRVLLAFGLCFALPCAHRSRLVLPWRALTVRLPFALGVTVPSPFALGVPVRLPCAFDADLSSLRLVS